MKILLTGASGSLGKELETEFSRRNLSCVLVASKRQTDPKYTKCDLSDLKQIRELKLLIEMGIQLRFGKT
jgi:short-subunit dehydrogenase